MRSTFTLAERYWRFHNGIFSGLEEPLPLAEGIESMPELDVQSLWYAGEFGTEFSTLDGKRVIIRDWGVWNAGAGPDFRDCAVQVESETLKGDIELDPDARDWERHAHGSNPDYNRVVLHLFVRQPAEGRFYTRTADHREVAQVVLSDHMLRTSNSRPGKQAMARIGRCFSPLSEMTDTAVSSLLEAAAQHRLQRKSKRLHLWVAAHGREQAIYQALAQALGYRNNVQPFLMLAQRLPLRNLLRRPENEREAMLFGVSGFLESVAFDEARADTKGYLRALWEDWWRLRAECTRWNEPPHRLRWRAAGARPGNHPQRRLGALCGMIRAWPDIIGPLKNPDSWSSKTWRKTMESVHLDYWDTHYTLLAEPSPKPLALLGSTRVQEMLANVVYPLLVPDKETLWAEYLELPALLDNEKVKRASLRLFGQEKRARIFQKKVFHHQGLLQLYEDFCLEDSSDCTDCPFPERLKEWQA